MAKEGDIILGYGHGICLANGSIILYKKFEDEDYGSKTNSLEDYISHIFGDNDDPLENPKRLVEETCKRYSDSSGDKVKFYTYSKKPKSLVPWKAIYRWSETGKSDWTETKYNDPGLYEIKIAGFKFYYNKNTENLSHEDVVRESNQKNKYTSYDILQIEEVFTERELKDKDLALIFQPRYSKICPTVVLQIKWKPENNQRFDGLFGGARRSPYQYYNTAYCEFRCLLDMNKDYTMYFKILGEDVYDAYETRYDSNGESELYDKRHIVDYIYKISAFDMCE